MMNRFTRIVKVGSWVVSIGLIKRRETKGVRAVRCGAASAITVACARSAELTAGLVRDSLDYAIRPGPFQDPSGT